MDRAGDVFIVSRTSWQTASILHVLSLRQAEVRQRPAPSQGQDEEAVILDKGACFRVEKILYKEYLQEPETQERIPEVWQRAVRSVSAPCWDWMKGRCRWSVRFSCVWWLLLHPSFRRGRHLRTTCASGLDG